MINILNWHYLSKIQRFGVYFESTKRDEMVLCGLRAVWMSKDGIWEGDEDWRCCNSRRDMWFKSGSAVFVRGGGGI